MNQGLTRRTLIKMVGIGAGIALINGFSPLVWANETSPQRGGVLRAAFAGSSSDSTNVLHSTNSNVDYVRARLIWDSLAEIDNQRIVWRLMESAEPNNDATRWTLNLRKGVTFSDGRKLTSKDVMFSLRTWLSQPGSQSGWLKPLDLAASRIDDDHQLTLQLHQPVGSFDLLLAQSIFIFPENTQDFTAAIGSGPYTLQSWSQDKSVLQARRDYWDADNGGPWLDEIQLYAISESAARLNGLKAGQFDYVGGMALLTARAEQNNPAMKLWHSASAEMSNLALSMNLSKAPFNRPEVVEALKYAIDREAMVRAVTMGLGEVANDALGAGQPWFSADLPLRHYDPQHAQSLLKKAGLTSTRIALRTSDYEYGTAESATLLLRQAKAAGFDLQLNRVPAADYYSDFNLLLNTPLQTNLYRPMPLPVALPFYYGSAAPWPFTGPATPQLDKLMSAMQAARGDALRQRVADVQHYLWQQGGDAIFARIPSVAASAPGVFGVKAAGFFDYPLLRDAWLRPA
ncbi:ABC transporter substrate-binding protein [Candidatus Pantoea multigeneris]|uniref:ABC transporter substrate-binding protein n=1 Tax=Candidatus Pantoea multigeneris TaxID=2608357 RepID=A0ABX0RA36_9GAMM|nr:ABC transporter substrate-binding protein [Pantoea multigeneris]NIF21634.1 ABC transporter substrate-binding protein [Pantoea multigeneris]